ncbi:SurA N-terminal domain-containing protein [Streptomyces sp. NBC_01498]|uniref:SurA N-terminal domain-containing protein n=1 Tax=Streptomyces sp. NBC_01498 TaxID=2975870 RepID=UPI002E7B2EA7|nr:SurA N-terminal domain-containing protein [Streptomyces sp. NBC_01498]WTL26489.1 SurA N-terminal domain-containing protein [Streptomyces sp. NBC_01498]
MYRRRRTALTLSAALLAAAPLLTACGNDAHPGAAAVVGGDRIEVSALQAQVRDVRDAQGKSPQAAELIKNTGRLGQIKLNSMIFDRILDKAAADAGVTATRKEIQTTRQSAAQQSGGEDQLAAMLLQQGALTPDQIDTAVRREVLMTKLAQALGANTTTPEGQQRVLDALVKTSEKLGIDVNPRYGAWDVKQVRLGEAKTPWLSQVTKEAAPEQVATGT